MCNKQQIQYTPRKSNEPCTEYSSSHRTKTQTALDPQLWCTLKPPVFSCIQSTAQALWVHAVKHMWDHLWFPVVRNKVTTDSPSTITLPASTDEDPDLLATPGAARTPTLCRTWMKIQKNWLLIVLDGQGAAGVLAQNCVGTVRIDNPLYVSLDGLLRILHWVSMQHVHEHARHQIPERL